MANTCPICERGKLSASVVDEVLTYSGRKLVVAGIEISVCDSCGEEVVLPPQAKRNDVRFCDARRKFDGLMTTVEIVAWRRRHSLTQYAAAEILGGGVNAFSRYERGEVTQSRSTDLLMRIADKSSVARAMLFGAKRDGWEDESEAVELPPARWATKVLIAANDDDLQWKPASSVSLVKHVQCH